MNLLLTTLAAALLALAAQSASAQSAGTLIANPSFAPSGATVPAGYLPAVANWQGTGTKSVGVDVVDSAKGLWLSQTRSVSTGSLSNQGWTTPKAMYLTTIPAGCVQQSVLAQFYFRGADPYVPSTSGVNVTFGPVVNTQSWQTSDSMKTVAFTTHLPAGQTWLSIGTIMGLKQINGLRAGVEVVNMQVTCQ